MEPGRGVLTLSTRSARESREQRTKPAGPAVISPSECTNENTADVQVIRQSILLFDVDNFREISIPFSLELRMVVHSSGISREASIQSAVIHDQILLSIFRTLI